MSWIDDYVATEGKLPPVSGVLKPVAEFHPAKDPIQKNMELKTPSGQLWNKWTDVEKLQWRQLVEWCDKDPEVFIKHMTQMLPETPLPIRKQNG